MQRIAFQSDVFQELMPFLHDDHFTVSVFQDFYELCVQRGLIDDHYATLADVISYDTGNSAIYELGLCLTCDEKMTLRDALIERIFPEIVLNTNT